MKYRLRLWNVVRHRRAHVEERRRVQRVVLEYHKVCEQLQRPVALLIPIGPLGATTLGIHLFVRLTIIIRADACRAVGFFSIKQTHHARCLTCRTSKSKLARTIVIIILQLERQRHADIARLNSSIWTIAVLRHAIKDFTIQCSVSIHRMHNKTIVLCARSCCQSCSRSWVTTIAFHTIFKCFAHAVLRTPHTSTTPVAGLTIYHARTF